MITTSLATNKTLIPLLFFFALMSVASGLRFSGIPFFRQSYAAFRNNNRLAPSTIFSMSTSSNDDINTQNNDDNMMKFGPFRLALNQIFYKTNLSAAFVNLRPIVPGHVLVMSNRVVPLLSDLTQEEYQDLWNTVRVVQATLQKHYTGANAFNVAVQDGQAAGQSVPHVHVHILPRVPGDYERNDDVYQDIQDWAPREEFQPRKSNSLDVPDDQDRKDRTGEEMAAEAAIYWDILNSSNSDAKL